MCHILLCLRSNYYIYIYIYIYKVVYLPKVQCPSSCLVQLYIKVKYSIKTQKKILKAKAKYFRLSVDK